MAETHPNKAALPKGVAGPALRALDRAGITSLSALSKWTESDLAELHGMGPRALETLKAALEAQGGKLRK